MENEFSGREITTLSLCSLSREKFSQKFGGGGHFGFFFEVQNEFYITNYKADKHKYG